MLRIGSLFSGVGGLDMAVEAFFEAETVWHCEVDPEPSKVLAARWPGVPNLGDITNIKWTPDCTETDILSRDPAIKACGNGVVPQQAYAALDGLWSRVLESIAA